MLPGNQIEKWKFWSWWYNITIWFRNQSNEKAIECLITVFNSNVESQIVILKYKRLACFGLYWLFDIRTCFIY